MYEVLHEDRSEVLGQELQRYTNLHSCTHKGLKISWPLVCFFSQVSNFVLTRLYNLILCFYFLCVFIGHFCQPEALGAL